MTLHFLSVVDKRQGLWKAQGRITVHSCRIDVLMIIYFIRIINSHLPMLLPRCDELLIIRRRLLLFEVCTSAQHLTGMLITRLPIHGIDKSKYY